MGRRKIKKAETFRQKKKRMWKDLAPSEHNDETLGEMEAFLGIDDLVLDNISRSGNVVYFIQMQDGWGPIKIGVTGGTSESLRSRMSRIQTGNPYLLCLLGTIGGDHYEESLIHKRFKEYRMVGEWFEAGRDLVDFAARFLAADAIANSWINAALTE